jgi:hypothetical protein
MNKDEIKNIFNRIQSNSQYIKVSEVHPLELYLGKNERGFLTLRYNGSFDPKRILGSTLLEVKQVKTDLYKSLLFCYTGKDNLSLFYNFCEDIINQTKDYHGEDGYVEIINRYNQWKKLFYSNTKVLSENEVVGLIGELLFLRDYAFPIEGIKTGLTGWSGPEPTHKDFSFSNEWFEIKTIQSYKNSIQISSIEQLDSDIDGHLVVFSLEKMSPRFDGISLNSLVLGIDALLTYEVEKDIFYEKLKRVGYSYNEIYDEYVYNYVGIARYRVNDDFPRLKADLLPLGVGKVSYELFLTLIEKYREDN